MLYMIFFRGSLSKSIVKQHSFCLSVFALLNITKEHICTSLRQVKSIRYYSENVFWPSMKYSCQLNYVIAAKHQYGNEQVLKIQMSICHTMK